MDVWHFGAAAGTAGHQGRDQGFQNIATPAPEYAGPERRAPLLEVVTSNAHDGPAPQNGRKRLGLPGRQRGRRARPGRRRRSLLRRGRHPTGAVLGPGARRPRPRPRLCEGGRRGFSRDAAPHAGPAGRPAHRPSPGPAPRCRRQGPGGRLRHDFRALEISLGHVGHGRASDQSGDRGGPVPGRVRGHRLGRGPRLFHPHRRPGCPPGKRARRGGQYLVAL